MQLVGMGGETSTAQAQTAPSPRLVKAAHEFEGQIMKELLKPMTNGDGLTGADDDTDSGAGSNGALGEFASETLGQGLSERGGFGIADRIIQELSNTGNQHGNGQVTQNLHQKDRMRTSQ